MRLRRDKMHMEVLAHRRDEIDKDTNRVSYTYNDLFDFLETLSKAELRQQVQIIPVGAGTTPEPIGLQPIIAAGTVQEFLHEGDQCHYEIHSSVDWKHHPEEVVMLAEGHGYGKHGDTMYAMEENEDGDTVLVGNKSGIAKPFLKLGPTEPTTKMGRSDAFHIERFKELTTEDLFNRLKLMCENGYESEDELTAIQAEMFRRMYRVTRVKK